MTETIDFQNIHLFGKAGAGVFRLSKELQGRCGWTCTDKSAPATEVTYVLKDLVCAAWQEICGGGQCLLKLNFRGVEGTSRFSGFAKKDFSRVKAFLEAVSQVKLVEQEVATNGWSWGDWQLQDQLSLQFMTGEKLNLELDLAELSQASVVGKTDLVVELQDTTLIHPEDEVLHSIRFFVPGGSSGEGTGTSAEQLKDQLQRLTSLSASGESFALVQAVAIVAPRGKHDLEFFPDSVKVRGKTQTHTIKYINVLRLFLLDIPDSKAHLLVVGLSQPLRQGNMSFSFIGLMFQANEKLSADGLKEDWKSSSVADKLSKAFQEGETQDKLEFIGKLLKALTGTTVARPIQAALRCSYKAQTGYLFFFKQSMMWVSKPIVWVKYSDIDSLHFTDSTLRTSTYDIRLATKGVKHEFCQFEQQTYKTALEHLEAQNVVTNLQEAKRRLQTLDDRGLATRSSGMPARRAAQTSKAAKADEEEDDDYNEEDDDDFDASDEADDGSEDDEDEEEKAPKKKARKSR